MKYVKIYLQLHKYQHLINQIQSLKAKTFSYISRPLNLCLLVSSADNFFKQMEPDQAQQNVGPDQNPNILTLVVFLKELF